MEKKYSVLISVYNKEKPEYLRDSINSMISQSLKPDEIVLVKDGKLSDALENVISNFVNNEPLLFNIISIDENIGLGKALDVGISHCKNELIARMDSDDISLAERCEMQVDKFIENPQLSIVGTMIDEFYDDPKKIVTSRIVPLEHNEIYKFMKRRSPFNHPTVMYKKSIVVKCGGYGNLRRKQDLDLFSRMINNGYIGANINKSLLLFRSNEDNFKRRKNLLNCKSYIIAEYTILKRGHCSLFDFIVVVTSQIIMFISPMWLIKKISNRYLRVQK